MKQRIITLIALLCALAGTASATTKTYTVSGGQGNSPTEFYAQFSDGSTSTSQVSWTYNSTAEISFNLRTNLTLTLSNTAKQLVYSNGAIGGRGSTTLTVSSNNNYYIYHVRLLDSSGNVIQLDANGNAVNHGGVSECDYWNMTKSFSHTYSNGILFSKIEVSYDTAIPITDAVISGLDSQYSVSNTAVTPTPTVTWHGKNLTNNTHYTLSYQNNTTAGTATVTATGKGIFSTSTNVSKNYTLYWATYSVTLDNQGATTAGTTEVTATYDAAMPAINVPTKTGYTFGGYYTETNGGGTKYYNADGTSANNWNIASATTLYAQWTGYALKRVNSINYSPAPTYSDDTYHYYAAGTEITLTPTHEHKIITAVYPTDLNAVIAANKRSATFTMPAQNVSLSSITQHEVYAVTLPEGITLSASGYGAVYHIEGTTYCKYDGANTWYSLNAPFGYSISNATYDGSPTTINNGKNGFYLKQKDAEVTATQTDQFGISDDADGTLTKPYVITTPEGLTLLTTYSFNQTSGQYFELGNDITYTPTGADDEHNFNGIQRFGGTFDGKGKTISGIRIYQSSSYQGLFQKINGGTVKNVVLNNARVRGTSNVGGITGYVDNGTIQNCLVLNSVITETDNDYYKGVIAGDIRRFSGSNNLYRNCSVNGKTYDVGAYNHDRDGASQAFTITLPTHVSAATGNSLTYDGTTYYGSEYNTVTLTYDNQPDGKVPLFTVTSVDNSSLVAETTSTFTMPKADVSVSADLRDGYTLTLPDDVTATGFSITTGSDTYYPSGTTISLSYQADGYEVVCSVNGSPLEGNTFTITGNTVVTVATNDVWGIADGADGSEQKPYVITTTAGLDLLAKKVKGTGIYSKNDNYYSGQFFKLGADITYTHKAANEEGADTESNYTPISYFWGTFDGQGHTISGIRIYQSDKDNLGLFSNINGGLVENFTVSDARITGHQYVGGIVGDNTGPIVNCLVIGTSVAGTSYVGAIVGRNDDDDGGILTNNHYSGCTININGELRTEGIGTGGGDRADAGPAIVLRNDVANTSVIAANKGSGKDVVLYGRTLYQDGAWNTLCLPFQLDNISYNLGDADIRTLSSASFSEGTLTLNFTEKGAVTSITAGVPYIVRWEKAEDYDTADPFTRDLVNPAFFNVTIPDNYADGSVTTTYVDFIGATSPVAFTANDQSKLFLGAGNTLYYPQTGANINAFRAYFQLNGISAADLPAGNVKMFFGEGDDTETGIVSMENGKWTMDNEAGAWYTIDGRRVNTPSLGEGRGGLVPGIYIHNGRKVVIK